MFPVILFYFHIDEFENDIFIFSKQDILHYDGFCKIFAGRFFFFFFNQEAFNKRGKKTDKLFGMSWGG